MNHGELIEKAAEASHDAYEKAADHHGWTTQRRSRVPWADVPEENKAAVRASLDAALPLIEADLRERIAGEIEALPVPHSLSDDAQTSWVFGRQDAARIVRGATRPTPTGPHDLESLAVEWERKADEAEQKLAGLPFGRARDVQAMYVRTMRKRVGELRARLRRLT